MEGLIDVAAQNLPNLLSMIGMFLQERRHQKDLTHQELYEFLDAHRFENLKRIILDTHDLERQIDVVLQAGQSEILAELKIISESLGKVASGMEIFGAVALAASPRIQLSRQALWMLQKIDQASSHHPYMSIFHSNLFIDCILYTLGEMRLVREDLSDLVSLGLIKQQSHNEYGEPEFGITRLGIEFVKQLPILPPDNVESFPIG